MNILFVCSGNTCRSPMALGLFEEAVGESEILDGEAEADSCGTFAAEDVPATKNSIKVMDAMGINIHRHKSKPFSSELAEWADLILTMQSEHLEEIEAMVPEAKGRSHTLSGYINGVYGFPGEGDYDIIDPYGSDIDDYKKCAGSLKNAIDKLIRKLEDMLKSQ